MKKYYVMFLILIVGLIGIQVNAAIVHEGFDYSPTDGSASINGLNGGIGFDGEWYDSKSGGSTNSGVITSDYIFNHPFPSVQSDGDGALQRPDKSGNAATARTISTAAQSALTGDGTTMWFSVLMKVKSGGISAFETNSYGTLIFGNAGLDGGNGTGAPAILDNGSAVGVGFAGSTGGNEGVQIQGVTYKDGDSSNSDQLTVGNNLKFIVGKVEWKADGSDDTISLYSIEEDSDVALPEYPFATMTADLDQSTFDTISIGDAQTAFFDEIRMGESYASVVPEPATIGLLAIGGLALLRRRNS